MFHEGDVLTDSFSEPPDPPHPAFPVCLSKFIIGSPPFEVGILRIWFWCQKK